MGAMSLPTSSGDAGLLRTVEAQPDRWLMAAAAFLYAAFALTVGIPTFFHLLHHRPRIAVLGSALLAFGTIGMAGYAALLILFRAMVLQAPITTVELAAISDDVGLRGFVGAFVFAFGLGLLVLGLALLLTRVVARWMALLIVAYPVGMPFADALPDWARTAQVLMLGAALIGVALSANAAWAARPRVPALR